MKFLFSLSLLMSVAVVLSACGISAADRLASVASTPQSLPTISLATIKHITDVVALRDDLVFVAADQSILKTTNGGVSWTRVTTFPSSIQFIDFIAEDEGWALVNNRLWHLAPSLPTWSELQDEFHSPTSLDFSSSSRGWVFANDGFQETTDGGTTWHKAPTTCGHETEDDLFDGPAFLLTDTIYYQTCAWGGMAGSRPNTLFITHNQGQTWNELIGIRFPNEFPNQLPSGGYNQTIFMLDEQRGWMSFDNVLYTDDPKVVSLMITTNDGWNTWRYVPSVPEGFIQRIAFTSPRHGYIISLSRGDNVPILAKTLNGGATWEVLHPVS